NNYSPELIQSQLYDEDVMRHICSILDDFACCHLSEEVFSRPHEEYTSVRNPTVDADLLVPSPSTRAFVHLYENVARSVNIHQHCATCHKGNIGKIKCRMGYPQHCYDTKSGPREIVKGENGKPAALLSLNPTPLSGGPPSAFGDQITRQRDLQGRAVMLDLYRPQPGCVEAKDWPQPYKSDVSTFHQDSETAGPNSNVVPFNPLLSACIRSNSCVSLLGNSTAATASLWYLLKYMGKDKAALTNGLTLALASLGDIHRRPSI